MREVGITACSSRKATAACAARDFYQGAAFSYARRWFEQMQMPWLILSAWYGVVTPEQVLAPYNLRLAQLPAAERRRWAAAAHRELLTRYAEATFVVVAGREYRAALAGLSWRSLVPLHQGIGHQLAYMKRLTTC